MTQPSGKLCDAPSHIGFCMRISPIICFFDGSCLLARTIFYAIKWRSFDKAAERIITERFAFDDPDAESYGSLIKSAKARWIVFIFCVVQSVKLFAFGGIIWSKVWAAMYLCSFIMTELLVVFPRKWIAIQTNLSRDDMPRDHGVRSIPYISTFLSAIFTLYFTTSAASSIFEVGLLQCAGPILIIFGGIPFAIAAAYSYTVRADPREFLPSYLYTLLVLFVPTLFLLAWLQRDPNSLPQWTTIILEMIMILVWSLLSLRWASVTFEPVIKKSREDTRRLEAVLAKYFFCFNLVTAVLYFRYSYQSTGTIKPPWTDIFG
ncbi:unnamed protein product [Alternaria alternata]|jgi:hypothetical protein